MYLRGTTTFSLTGKKYNIERCYVLIDNYKKLPGIHKKIKTSYLKPFAKIALNT